MKNVNIKEIQGFKENYGIEVTEEIKEVLKGKRMLNKYSVKARFELATIDQLQYQLKNTENIKTYKQLFSTYENCFLCKVSQLNPDIVIIDKIKLLRKLFK